MTRVTKATVKRLKKELAEETRAKRISFLKATINRYEAELKRRGELS